MTRRLLRARLRALLRALRLPGSFPGGWRPAVGAERGAAVVEIALVVPILVLIASASTYAVRTVLDYTHVAHLSEVGARYATRAALDPGRPGDYSFRPTAEQVAGYVREAAEVDVFDVTVTPEPALARPGDEIEIVVTTHVELGPLGRAANAIAGAFAGLFGGGRPFPDDGYYLSASTVMREE